MNLFKSISKFFKFQAYANNTIMVLIGSRSMMLTAYNTKGFTRTINIPNDDLEFLGRYRSFLNQFKGWNVVLLIDENVKIHHEELPVLNYVIKTEDAAKKFVLSAVKDGDIVAYSKSVKETDARLNVENVTYCYTTPATKLLEIISFVYNFNFSHIAVHILSLEMQEIIKVICDSANLDIEGKFVIFITPTLSSGIRLFVLERGVLLLSKVIDYPDAKSQEYIAGQIMQSVSEVRAKYKKHIVESKIEVEVVSLTSTACAKAITNNGFDLTWHALSWSNIKQKLTFSDFGDEMIIHSLQLKYPASNKPLRQIYFLENIKMHVIRPLMIFVACILFYAGWVEYKVLRTDNNAKMLHDEYYKVSEKYREARKSLQGVNNLPHIYDIISDIAILKAPVLKPFEIWKHVVDINDKRDNISEILWRLTNSNIGEMESELILQLKYSDISISINVLQEHLNEYRTSLARLFPSYKIEFADDKSVELNVLNKVTIPVRFIIKGPAT